MKTLFAAACGAALLSSAALAADLPTYEPPPLMAPTPMAYNWTGFYIGAQAGWVFGEADAEFDTAGLDDLDYEPDGFVVGGHIGYNQQFGMFVAGVEADAEWTDVDGDDESLTTAGSIEMNWQGSIRGRLGAAFDRVLLYVTAGGAFADVDVEGGPPAGALDGFSEGQWGWTAGAGVEAAVTDNITARVEYRYTDFGEFEGSVEPAFAGTTESVDLQTHAIRGAISYKF